MKIDQKETGLQNYNAWHDRYGIIRQTEMIANKTTDEGENGRK